MKYQDGTLATSRSPPNQWNEYQRLRRAELSKGAEPWTNEDIRSEWNGFGPDKREEELGRLRALPEE
jgi:hypothetical protein